MYRYGYGCSINYNKSFKWFSEAAENSNALALANLGTIIYLFIIFYIYK